MSACEKMNPCCERPRFVPRCVAVWVVLGAALLCVPQPASAMAPIQHFTSTGGLRVLLVESHALPMVVARLVIPAGSAHETKGQEGVAALTATMLPLGAGEFNAEAFQERLDFHGIRLSADSGQDTMGVQFTTLTPHLDEAWARLGDAVLRPRFDAKVLEGERIKLRAILLKDLESPSRRGADQLFRLLYAGHPYAHPAQGELESLPGIGVEELRRFHRDAVHAPGMVLAVAGDVDQARLRQLVETHLKGLDPTPSPFASVPLAERGRKGERQHLTMDSPQTAITMGVVGVDRNDPDYFAALVMNHILGGSPFTSRLTEEIREKRGLTYGVRSYFARMAGRGPFLVSVRTKNETVDEVIALVRQELKRMVEEGVSDAELDDAKNYLTGSFPMRLDGLAEQVSNLANMALHDLGLDYLETWQEKVRRVSREEVQRVAGRFLDQEGFTLVTVGGGVVKEKE